MESTGPTSKERFLKFITQKRHYVFSVLINYLSLSVSIVPRFRTFEEVTSLSFFRGDDFKGNLTGKKKNKRGERIEINVLPGESERNENKTGEETSYFSGFISWRFEIKGISFLLDFISISRSVFKWFGLLMINFLE